MTMTREEAIHFAVCLKNNWTINFADMEEFCDMAIDALSEPSGDLISREDAIAAMGEEPPVWLDTAEEWAERDAWVLHVSALKALPSAEAEPKCIAQIKGDTEEIVRRIKEEHASAEPKVFTEEDYWRAIDAEWIPFRDDLLIRENAAEAVGEFFNKMDISLFGRTGVRLARNVLKSVPTVAPLKWIPLNKDGYEPLFEGDYLLCLDDGYIANVYYDGSDWELWADSGDPIAWMPLPPVYREDGEEE